MLSPCLATGIVGLSAPVELGTLDLHTFNTGTGGRFPCSLNLKSWSNDSKGFFKETEQNQKFYTKPLGTRTLSDCSTFLCLYNEILVYLKTTSSGMIYSIFCPAIYSIFC